MAPHSSTLAWKSHGQRSLVGCSPWGREESDMTEWLHFHFSLSCIGEGNGNPLQCSCLENPMDRGARWAAIYGVAQNRTWLKGLSSSSSKVGYQWKWLRKTLRNWLKLLFAADIMSKSQQVCDTKGVEVADKLYRQCNMELQMCLKQED